MSPFANSCCMTGCGKFELRNAISCSKRSDPTIAGRASSASGVVTFAPQLDALPFLLAVFAAVLAVRAAFLNHARTGGVGAFGGLGHREPPRPLYGRSV